MSSVCFQFDEHIANAATLALRREGIDVVTAHDLGLRGTADLQILAHAHAASRVLVTQDKDYLRLNAIGQPHSGIVYWSRQTKSLGQLIELLLLIHGALSAEQMVGRVEFV